MNKGGHNCFRVSHVKDQNSILLTTDQENTLAIHMLFYSHLEVGYLGQCQRESNKVLLTLICSKLQISCLTTLPKHFWLSYQSKKREIQTYFGKIHVAVCSCPCQYQFNVFISQLFWYHMLHSSPMQTYTWNQLRIQAIKISKYIIRSEG